MIKFRDDLHGCESTYHEGDITLTPINDDPYNIGVAYNRYRTEQGLERDKEVSLSLQQYDLGTSPKYELASYLETLPIHVHIGVTTV